MTTHRHKKITNYLIRVGIAGIEPTLKGPESFVITIIRYPNKL